MIEIIGKKIVTIKGVKLAVIKWGAETPRCRYCECSSHGRGILQNYCISASRNNEQESIECRGQDNARYILLAKNNYRRVKVEHKLLIQQGR